LVEGGGGEVPSALRNQPFLHPAAAYPGAVERYHHTSMAKEKVTLTLDAETLAALRRLVGPRSLSAAVEAAVAERVARLQHLAAVDEWLAELDRAHGPVPPETLEWAARLVEEWDEKRRRKMAG